MDMLDIADAHNNSQEQQYMNGYGDIGVSHLQRKYGLDYSHAKALQDNIRNIVDRQTKPLHKNIEDLQKIVLTKQGQISGLSKHWDELKDCVEKNATDHYEEHLEEASEAYTHVLEMMRQVKEVR